MEAWRPLAEHSGLRLVRDGAARAEGAAARRGRSRSVLDAVLDNAIKFSPPGGAIAVRTRRPPDEVEIAVRDTGPGLAPEELDRATDRFWRSPAQSNVEGSGLGLAIAARTVELAGGGLRLELPAGGGLRVVARLRAAGRTRRRVPTRSADGRSVGRLRPVEALGARGAAAPAGCRSPRGGRWSAPPRLARASSSWAANSTPTSASASSSGMPAVTSRTLRTSRRSPGRGMP